MWQVTSDKWHVTSVTYNSLFLYMSSGPCHLPTVDIPDNHGEVEYNGLYDEGESSSEVNLSAPLPPGVKEAELPDRRLTEVRVDGKSINTLSGHGGYRDTTGSPRGVGGVAAHPLWDAPDTSWAREGRYAEKEGRILWQSQVNIPQVENKHITDMEAQWLFGGTKVKRWWNNKDLKDKLKLKMFLFPRALYGYCPAHVLSSIGEWNMSWAQYWGQYKTIFCTLEGLHVWEPCEIVSL